MRRGTGRARDGPIVACATRAGRPIEGAGPGTAGAGTPATSMLEGIQVRVAWCLRIPGREVSITGVEVGFPSWAGALQRKYGALAVIERPAPPAGSVGDAQFGPPGVVDNSSPIADNRAARFRYLFATRRS